MSIYRHRLCQLQYTMQRAVGDAEIIEMNHDVAQVIQRGAVCADTLHDQCRRAF